LKETDMEEKNITTRARELVDDALVAAFDGRLALCVDGHGDVQLGLYNCDRDPLFISLAALLERAMSEAAVHRDAAPAVQCGVRGPALPRESAFVLSYPHCTQPKGHAGDHSSTAGGGVSWSAPDAPEAPAEGQTQCEATFRAVGHTYRCELAAGHPGRHADGGLWWSDPGETATARLVQLRQESFDQGREQGLGEAHELIVQVAEGLTEAEGDAEIISRIVVALMRTAGALRDKSAG
jgi:hypothetical protein